MCQLANIIKNVGPNEQALKLMKMQFEGMKTQKDGCAALIIDKDDKIEVFKQLAVENYQKVFDKTVERFDDAKFIGLHTRISTGGTTDERNIHFFKPNNFYFAHNGYVSQYGTFGYWSKNHKDDDAPDVEFEEIWEKGGEMIKRWHGEVKFVWSSVRLQWLSFTDAYNTILDCRGCQDAKLGYCRPHKYIVDEMRDRWTKESPTPKKETVKEEKKDMKDYCDSYQFAAHLPKNLDPEIIQEAMDKDRFSGMATLVKEDGKEAYLLVDKKCYSISDKETFAAFFSYDPVVETKKRYYYTLCGVRVDAGEKTEEFDIEPVEIFQGVYEMDINSINGRT